MQQRGSCSLELPYATNGSVVCRIRQQWVYPLLAPLSPLLGAQE